MKGAEYQALSNERDASQPEKRRTACRKRQKPRRREDEARRAGG